MSWKLRYTGIRDKGLVFKELIIQKKQTHIDNVYVDLKLDRGGCACYVGRELGWVMDEACKGRED